MSTRAVATLAVRIFGLWLLFSNLRVVGATLEFMIVEGSLPGSLFAQGLVVSSLLVATGVVLFVAPGWLAEQATRNLADEAGREEDMGVRRTRIIGAVETQPIAFAIVGVVLLALGIRSAGSVAGTWIEATRQAPDGIGDNFSDFLFSQARGEILETTVLLAMGLGLAFGAQGLSRILMRIRGDDSIRTRRIEVTDELGDARLVLGTGPGGAPEVVGLDEEGNQVWTWPVPVGPPTGS